MTSILSSVANEAQNVLALSSDLNLFPSRLSFLRKVKLERSSGRVDKSL